MNLRKIGKRLKRELTRNPKKTGVLFLMCLIGIYSWLPIFRSEKNQPANAMQRKVALNQPLKRGDHPTKVSQKKKVRMRWFEIDQWIENDKNMETAQLQKEHLEPFSKRKKRDPTNRQQVLNPNLFTPQELGMELTSTVISRNLKLAIINGKKYKENETVNHSDRTNQSKPAASASGDDDDDFPNDQIIVFKIQQIHRKYVVLSRNNNKYRIYLKPAMLSEGDQIARSDNPNIENP